MGRIGKRNDSISVRINKKPFKFKNQMKEIINDIRRADKEDIFAVCYAVVAMAVMIGSVAVFG